MSRAWKSGVIATACALAAIAAAATTGVIRLSGNAKPAAVETAAAATTSAEVAQSATRQFGPAGSADESGGNGTWIVVYREPALAAYRGGIANLSEPSRTVGARGKAKLDVNGAAARNYVSYLKNRQATIESGIQRTLGKPMAVRTRMQHAVNGVIADMTAAEAERVRALPEVLLVEGYREYAMDTDVGPALIGAEPVWTGTNPGAPAAYQGEGVVFGILDSGINFGSPSFAAVSPADGYVHVNPLGSGNFLGTCQAGQVDAGRCNDKLIGGYDFVCAAPGNQCGVANVREEPGFGDTNGHGSHTASTAGGNRRDVEFGGHDLRIAGVAPRANIIAYDICYYNTSTGQGLCPNSSAVSAVNQAIADGIVDVINYSIGGGASPWSEAVSLAFLNAVDAGIYVSSSAGNSGPGPNTMGHLEPWVSSTAASQHGRGDFLTVLEVTGPQPVPEPLSAIIMNPGSNGVAQTATIPGNTPLVVSSGINGASDGCAPYGASEAASMAGAIVVIRRGTCSFTIKTDNAAAAGAVAVIIANNAAGGIIPSVPDTSIPAFGMLQADGNALASFAAANPDATTGGIPFPAIIMDNVPDALGSFSSRGPAGNFNLLKPDVTAPGVRVLAVVAGTTLTGFENAIDLYNGTSMAAPHQAGAAALVRQARPGWTVPEIKSALAMTADETVLLEDEETPATPFGAGSGRVRVDRAINAGLVMHETTANYLAANPATGGDPAALNQPSYANRNCFTSCVFQRSFRNTQAKAMVWNVRLEGFSGRLNGSTLKFAANGTATLNVSIDSRSIPADGVWRFGRIVLTPATAGTHASALHLPVAIAVAPPVIVLPDIVASMQAGRSGNATGAIGNAGGSTLAYSISNTGNGTATVVDVPRGTSTGGYASAILSDNVTPALFASDDFTLAAPVSLKSIYTEGFIATSGSLVTTSTRFGWAIFPDAGGNPAGNPLTSLASAVWSYESVPSGPGITVTTSGQFNHVHLDLAAAGQTATLPAGRYWLVPYSRGPTAYRWIWFGSQTATGNFRSMTQNAAGTGAWTTPAAAYFGLNLGIVGEVPCGAPWIGAVTPASGNVLAGASNAVRVALSSAHLAAGSNNVAYVCATSNDPAKPKAAGLVRLTVTP